VVWASSVLVAIGTLVADRGHRALDPADSDQSVRGVSSGFDEDRDRADGDVRQFVSR
jgi:hypothetical protein